MSESVAAIYTLSHGP